MKIYLIPEGDPTDATNFVTRIRLLEPLASIARRYPLSWTCHAPFDNPKIGSFDLVIAQRACFGSFSELDHGLALLHEARRLGIPVVYELDDHIFCANLPELIAQSAVDEIDNEAYALTQAHKVILDIADFVTCSTHPLAEAIEAMQGNVRIHVLPVALDFDNPRWAVPTPTPSTSVAIGWSGGSRVGRDLEYLIPVLEQVLHKHPRLIFLLSGSLKYSRLFEHLPAQRVRFLSWVPYDAYPSLLAKFDLALLPMHDHAYNRCKSPLKVIDFGALGIPSICSPTEPFLEVSHEVAGFAKTIKDWVELIEHYVCEREHEKNRATRRARILQQFHLNRTQDHHWKILNEMVRIH